MPPILDPDARPSSLYRFGEFHVQKENPVPLLCDHLRDAELQSLYISFASMRCHAACGLEKDANSAAGMLFPELLDKAVQQTFPSSRTPLESQCLRSVVPFQDHPDEGIWARLR